MEKGGVPDHIHIGVGGDELPQAFHRVPVGLGLPDIKGDLVLKILPAVGHGVIHMHRVPDEVSQKADGILMEGEGLFQHHAAAVSVVPPGRGGHDRPGRAVHHLPPAFDVVPGIDLYELRTDALHQRDGQRAAGGGIEAGHDVALLYLFQMGPGPGVVLPGGVVGGVDLGVHSLEGLGVVGAVAVPDGVGAPALQDLQRLWHHIHIRGDGDAPPVHLLTHRHLSPKDFRLFGLFKRLVVEHQGGQQQHDPRQHERQAGQLAGHLPAHDEQHKAQDNKYRHKNGAQGGMFLPKSHRGTYPFRPPTVMPWVSFFCTQI